MMSDKTDFDIIPQNLKLRVQGSKFKLNKYDVKFYVQVWNIYINRGQKSLKIIWEEELWIKKLN